MSLVTTNTSMSGGSDPVDPSKAPQKGVVALGTPQVDSSSKNNAIATRPPEGFYVVLGRGAAGVVNLTTLLQSPWGKTRLAHPNAPDTPLQIKVFGLHDPWGIYHPHGMGQPPHLLCMPGFAKKPEPGAPTIRSGMNSRAFAQITADQAALVKKQCNHLGRYEWVPFIQVREPGGGGRAIDDKLITALEKEGMDTAKLRGLLASDYPGIYPPYRLMVIDERGDCKLEYAFKIDICIGLGRPQNEVALKTTDEARTQLWRPDDTWPTATRRRVMATGPEALMSTTEWRQTDRICVFGAGGIGLNMIERGEDVKCHIDWFPNTLPGNANRPAATSLHRSFNLPRNDTVLKTPKSGPKDPGRPMKPNESEIRNVDTLAVENLKFPLYPATPHWRFANGTLLDKVTKDMTPKGGVNVEAKSGGATAATIMDYDQNETTIDAGGFPYSPWFTSKHDPIVRAHTPPTHYDRVFFCVGFNFDTELGIPKTIIAGDVKAIMHDGRVVGLQSLDENVRFLGAAYAMHPARANLLNGTSTAAYFTDLPYSAVQPGFIYAGVTIAEANQWFDKDHPNTNINTMAKKDLVEHFKTKRFEPDAAEALATDVIKHRRLKNGWAGTRWAESTVEPLVHEHHVFNSKVQNWDWGFEGLDFDYGDPRPWITWP